MNKKLDGRKGPRTAESIAQGVATRRANKAAKEAALASGALNADATDLVKDALVYLQNADRAFAKLTFKHMPACQIYLRLAIMTLKGEA
jgi:hypothetical protein